LHEFIALVRNGAGVRVAPQHVQEMSRRFRVPVVIDKTGWLRYGVEIRFTRGSDRTIEPLGVRVGLHTNIDDVMALGDVPTRSTRYNEVLRDLRSLRDQLRALIDRPELEPIWRTAWFGRARRPGRCNRRELACTAPYPYDELLNLDEMIARRQSRRMGYGTVRVETLDMEIDFLRRHHARLSDEVAHIIDVVTAALLKATSPRDLTATCEAPGEGQ
jgi:hypothetical protein